MQLHKPLEITRATMLTDCIIILPITPRNEIINCWVAINVHAKQQMNKSTNYTMNGETSTMTELIFITQQLILD